MLQFVNIRGIIPWATMQIVNLRKRLYERTVEFDWLVFLGMHYFHLKIINSSKLFFFAWMRVSTKNKIMKSYLYPCKCFEIIKLWQPNIGLHF